MLSIEMQTAQKADQAVIREFDNNNNIEVEYVDNEQNTTDVSENANETPQEAEEVPGENTDEVDDEDLKKELFGNKGFNSADQF